MIEFYKSLVDAVKRARGTNLEIIDGPEDNYAVVDIETACGIQDCLPENVTHYGFYSLAEAEAIDKANYERKRSQWID